MVVGKLIAGVHIVGSFLFRLIGINSGLDERRFGVQGKSRKGDQCCSMDGSEGRPLHLEWKTTRIMVLVWLQGNLFCSLGHPQECCLLHC